MNRRGSSSSVSSPAGVTPGSPLPACALCAIFSMRDGAPDQEMSAGSPGKGVCHAFPRCSRSTEPVSTHHATGFQLGLVFDEVRQTPSRAVRPDSHRCRKVALSLPAPDAVDRDIVALGNLVDVQEEGGRVGMRVQFSLQVGWLMQAVHPSYMSGVRKLLLASSSSQQVLHGRHVSAEPGLLCQCGNVAQM